MRCNCQCYAEAGVGLNHNFVAWVRMCISTASFSINLNGSLKEFLSGTRGVRQGCPMSPYIFVLVMEILNAIISSKLQNNEYGLHHRCEDPIITHLCFADDLFAFFRGDVQSANVLANALQLFRTSTEFSVNVNKSNIFGAGMNRNTLELIASILHFPICSLPVKYLGLPLISTRLRYDDCLPLISKVEKRINSWKGRFLSYAGRMLLIKAVLTNMQVYWTSFCASCCCFGPY